MTKKQFNLEDWLKDKSQNVVTRCGYRVRIVCWDRKDEKYPIIALVDSEENYEKVQSYTTNGRIWEHTTEDYLDLFIEKDDSEVSVEEARLNRIIAILKNLKVADGDDILLKDIAWLESIVKTKCWKPQAIFFSNSNNVGPAGDEIKEELDNYFRQFKGLEDYDWRIDSLYLMSGDIADFAHHFTEWQKQQMMKDAVEIPFEYDTINATLTYKQGKKVKVIFIKE